MDIPDTLIDLQRAADAEWAHLAELTDNDERGQQGRAWYDAGARAQAAVTEWAREAARQSAPHPWGCSYRGHPEGDHLSVGPAPAGMLPPTGW
ncbi:hypothetical protein ABZ863_35375 [Saccharomonospora sp. NPDC046836]|uniref:hypothetical protein n=1 Tax=Saccharomonospora sp. NPDC046836 TaxID=3156921 RepID=UPI0033FC2ECD